MDRIPLCIAIFGAEKGRKNNWIDARDIWLIWLTGSKSPMVPGGF
jgi:hypothetical protein